MYEVQTRSFLAEETTHKVIEASAIPRLLIMTSTSLNRGIAQRATFRQAFMEGLLQMVEETKRSGASVNMTELPRWPYSVPQKKDQLD